MKRTLFALWLLLLVPAFGGNGAGNGGFAFVRRDHSTQAIQEVRFHDLWWGENELGLHIHRRDLPAEQQAREMVERLFTLDEEAFRGVAQELDRVVRKKKILNEGITLVEPADLYKHIVPEQGSDSEVVAFVNYTDDNVILVRRDLWQFLSDASRARTDYQSDIAAMYLHEALWKLIRTREQEKPVTSKEAAAVVAHLFSDDTNDEFLDWYRNFRSTGKLQLPDPIQEIRLEEGIYGETFGDKSKEENIARSRKSWEERCQAWRETVTKRLTPTSQYVYALCRTPKVSEPIDDVAYSVSSHGLIVAKPKTIYLNVTEWVRGKMIPLNIASGYPFWRSDLSYEERCAAWKEEVSKRLGNHLFYASCGLEMVDTPDRVDYFTSAPSGAFRSAEVPHYKKLAHQAVSIGNVILLGTDSENWRSEKIEGGLFNYDNVNDMDILVSTSESWEEACRQFKTAHQDAFYATCDNGPLPRDFPYEIKHSSGQIKMESYGRIYPWPKKKP